MTSKTIYLAGDMRSGWQDRAAPLLVGHVLLDPRTHGLEDPAQYTVWDLDAVRRSDVVLAYMSPSNPSGFGLSLEVGYAVALGIRVIFADEMRDDHRSRYFAMHRQVARVFYSLEDACANV